MANCTFSMTVGPFPLGLCQWLGESQSAMNVCNSSGVHMNFYSSDNSTGSANEQSIFYPACTSGPCTALGLKMLPRADCLPATGLPSHVTGICPNATNATEAANTTNTTTSGRTGLVIAQSETPLAKVFSVVTLAAWWVCVLH